VPTSTANGCGALEAVNADDPFAALECHVLDDGDELGKAQIAHLAAPQPFHALQVQVFKHQHVVLVIQSIGEFEVEVSAFVGDADVRARQQPLRISLVVAAILFARDSPVQLAHPITTGQSRAQLAKLLIFSPQTVLNWHRELVRRKWTFGDKRQVGCPLIAEELRQLVIGLANENNSWSYDRIVGELLKLGYSIDISVSRPTKAVGCSGS